MRIAQKLTAQDREKRRLMGGRLLRAGELSQSEIARRLDVSREAVRRWAEQLRESSDGLAALKNRPRTGRPPRLTTEQWRETVKALQAGVTPHGFERGPWTSPKLRALVEQLWGNTYLTESYLERRLKEMGWAPPRRTAPRRAQSQVEPSCN